jgi:two-component system, NarL family, nitrate/nitrite response regulator NarL
MPVSDATIRIGLVDDHEIFRAGLRRLLVTEPGFDVVGEASDGQQAIELVRSASPDIVLLDIAMPRMGGIEALSAIGGSTRVILLTASLDSTDLLHALRLGANGVVLKDSAPRLLIDGIRDVMAGRYLVGTGAAGNLAEALKRAATPPARRYDLTPRELEVVKAIVAGESNRDIADRFGISQQTVKHHLSSVFDKTGVSTRLELALLAIRQGIIRPD